MLYLVTAKCGHVGRGMYVEKVFPIKAGTKSEAAKKVLGFPRVKKQLKNAITNVVETNQDEFDKYVGLNNGDIYLKAKCRKDMINEELILHMVEMPRKKKEEFESRRQRILFKQKRCLLKEAGLYEYAY